MTVETPAAPATTPAAITTPAATPAAAATPAPTPNPATVTPEPVKTPAAAPAAPKNTILGGASAPAKEVPAAKPEGAPEKYADFTLPEGVEIKSELLETFKASAKELGLSQASAQKLVDLQAQNVKAEIDGRLAAFSTQVETWDKETRAHFGAEADKQFAVAARTMEQIGTPELRTLLNESGLGSHPEMVRFFAKAGAMLLEDQPVDGKRAGGEVVSTASLMFPTMAKK